MSDFRDLLKTRRDETLYGTRFRSFLPLNVGPYQLSVQASETHYCEPRETLDELRHYTRWECAAWIKDEWLSPERNPEVFDGMEVTDGWESGTHPVGGYLTSLATAKAEGGAS